jgi:chemotaxis protein methyltransferase CheR
MTHLNKDMQIGATQLPGNEGDLTDIEVAYLCRLVRESTGVKLDADKAYVVHCRLNVLAMAKGMRSPREIYRKLALNQDPGLAREVIDTLLTKETSFFRNPPVFKALKDLILPDLVGQKGAVRVWCVACSTGQEPYSVAMVAHDFGLVNGGAVFRIRATDYSKSALAKASAGRYSQLEISRGLPATMAVRYMEQKGHEFEVRPAAASLVDFSVHNLLDVGGYRGVYDLIMCRNVLIYFDLVEREMVVNSLTKCLAPGGYLLLGASECSAKATPGLTREQHGGAVFFRKES